MKTLACLIAILVPLAPSGRSQQPPSNQQYTQTQAQIAPCTTGQPQAAASPNHKPSFADRVKQKINDESSRLGTRTGVPMPTTDDAGNLVGTKPAPCPSKGAPSASPAPQPPAVSHLPIGVITTWLCNPIVTSTDPSHTVTFVTPDALTSAEPTQASSFEADGAKADPKATVSCAKLRRDPKNNKVFLAQ